MATEKIGTRNASYQKFIVLKSNRNKRHRYRQFFVEGVRNIRIALERDWKICGFLFSSEQPLSYWAANLLAQVKTARNYDLSAELMQELSGKNDTSELLAIVEMRDIDYSDLQLNEEKAPLIALFDRPSNHGNLGAIIRSCDAFGVDALILTGHSVDLYDPEVIAATMGSFFTTSVIREPSNARLFHFFNEMKRRYADFQIVGTTAHQETPIFAVDFTRPTVLILGNEKDGVCYSLKEKCNVLATLPMATSSSASSLNVACAATAMLYETTRQRIKV